MISMPSTTAQRDYERACDRLARLIADLGEKRADVFASIQIEAKHEGRTAVRFAETIDLLAPHIRDQFEAVAETALAKARADVEIARDALISAIKRDADSVSLKVNK